MSDDTGEPRWHSYLMLALGAVFLALGIANAILVQEREPPRTDMGGSYYGSPPGPAPFAILGGVVCLVIGAYAYYREREWP